MGELSVKKMGILLFFYSPMAAIAASNSVEATISDFRKASKFLFDNVEHVSLRASVCGKVSNEPLKIVAKGGDSYTIGTKTLQLKGPGRQPEEESIEEMAAGEIIDSGVDKALEKAGSKPRAALTASPAQNYSSAINRHLSGASPMLGSAASISPIKGELMAGLKKLDFETQEASKTFNDITDNGLLPALTRSFAVNGEQYRCGQNGDLSALVEDLKQRAKRLEKVGGKGRYRGVYFNVEQKLFFTHRDYAKLFNGETFFLDGDCSGVIKNLQDFESALIVERRSVLKLRKYAKDRRVALEQEIQKLEAVMASCASANH